MISGFTEPNAFATGLGPSRRVFLWKPIVEPPFTPRDDRFVLAHELGHLAHNHIWKSIAWYALFIFPLAYLLALVARRRGGMGVPEAVPLVIFAYVVLQLAMLPLQNVVSRHMEAEADWSALRATRDPAAGRAAVPALRSRDRRTTRARRGGTTSSSRTTRRCCSGSR